MRRKLSIFILPLLFLTMVIGQTIVNQTTAGPIFSWQNINTTATDIDGSYSNNIATERHFHNFFGPLTLFGVKFIAEFDVPYGIFGVKVQFYVKDASTNPNENILFNIYVEGHTVITYVLDLDNYPSGQTLYYYLDENEVEGHSVWFTVTDSTWYWNTESGPIDSWIIKNPIIQCLVPFD